MSALQPIVRYKSRRETIEDQARFVALDLWNRRNELWHGSRVPTHPVYVLEPSVSLVSHGYRVTTVASLDEISQDGIRTEAAGIMDRINKEILISARYSLGIQRFTLAHELGHVILHPNADVLHRDRPIDGPSKRRDGREQEADWFAAFLLMPERQVRRFFLQSFDQESIGSCDPLFAFSTEAKPMRHGGLQGSLRQRSLELALATHYGGREIPQLSRLFGVTATTMAIRLEELGLVTQ